MSVYTERQCACCGNVCPWPEKPAGDTRPRCAYCRAYCGLDFSAKPAVCEHHG